MEPCLFITNDHWLLAMIINDVLQTFDNLTNIFSYVYEPNIYMVILECIKIMHSISQTSAANPNSPVKSLLDNMNVKWHPYFNELPYIYGIAAILNLGVKVDERLCEVYGAVIQPEFVGSYSRGRSRIGFLRPVLKKQRPDSSLSDWWKNHSSKFSFLARIAKVLAISASTITSERAFSLGRRVFDEKDLTLVPKALKCVS
ncbi:putative AC9 transposase, partial [Bienertia sinuspersici]